MNDLFAVLNIGAWPPTPDALFWIALALVAGAALGEIVFRVLGLPRIVGYSTAGMALSVAGLGVGPGPLPEPVRLIVDLALALLLFELGSRVSLRWLRTNPTLLWTSALESMTSFTAICAVLFLLGFDVNFALACAALTVSASGAVIARVAAELKSAGQVTERMIVLSALNTVYAVLLLKLVTGWLHMDLHGDWARGVSQPLYAIAASLLLANLLSRAVSWVLRRFEMSNENTVLFLLGLILLALSVARMLGLSTLLVPLLAGVMLRNASERPCLWPRHFGTAGGVLVIMLFIALGATWSWTAVTAGAFTALALLVVRWLAKAGVLMVTARASGIQERQGFALALGLSPLSATTLVLLADLRVTHPELALQLSPVILTAIAAMAVIGPIAVQWGLRLAGEQQRPATSFVKELT